MTMTNADGRPPADVRDAVDRAVHRAVCELLGTDGAGACAYYAFAGALACSWATATSTRYIPQVGSAEVVYDPGPQGSYRLN